MGIRNRDRVYKIIRIEISFKGSKESFFFVLWDFCYCRCSIYLSGLRFFWTPSCSSGLSLRSGSITVTPDTCWIRVLQLHSQAPYLLDPSATFTAFSLSDSPAHGVWYFSRFEFMPFLQLVPTANTASMGNGLSHCFHQTYCCVNTHL